MTAEILCLVLLQLGMPKGERAEFACRHLDVVIDAAKSNRLAPDLLVAMIYTESRWNPKAVSRSGACGLTQVLPKYTRKPRLKCKDLFDPELSIEVGAKKLNYWIYKYGRGNKRTGLCGYNAGFRCKGKHKNKRGMYYAKKVLKRAAKIKRKYKKINKSQGLKHVK
mgnify:FL=1|tara:strand:- start:1980 stop:2477 length:498 start_codon:yes stop_codon:yes gene_type:complete